MAQTLNQSGASKDETASILSKSANGAKYLIILQVASRGLTFAANQVVLRFISPRLLGIATQLDIYTITILSFSRDALRLAIQRQRDTPTVQQTLKTTDDETNGVRPSPVKLSAAEKSQAVVNLAYISLCLGLLFAAGLGWLRLRFQDSSTSAVNMPYFKESLALYAFAAVLELAAEPCFVVVQQKSEYKIRAAAESCGTLLRCLMTCGLMVLASMRGLNVGVLPFAIGQLAFGLGVYVVYYWKVTPIARHSGFSLMPRSIVLESNSQGAISYFSKPLLSLAGSLFLQGIVKTVLTEGDGLMIALMASLPAQGLYALASAYGGLVARLVFQPIEEGSRNYFGKLLSNVDGEPSLTSIQSANRDLTSLLRVYSLLSTCAVVIGPSAAPVLLKLVVGSRWSDSGAGDLLAKYCFYIPLLAFNGVLESFVSVVATEAQLNRQSAWMLGFSVVFASSGFIFLHQLDLGATGLVYANMVNMIARIAWCFVFITKYLRQHSSKINISEILPTWSTMALSVGTSSIIYQRRFHYKSDGLEELVLLGSISACFLVLLAISEQKFLKQCYRSTRTPNSS